MEEANRQAVDFLGNSGIPPMKNKTCRRLFGGESRFPQRQKEKGPFISGPRFDVPFNCA